MKINGKVVYQNLEMGFWGIIANNGKEYRPVNMPEQLKMEGAAISIVAHEVDVMSFVMWGTPIQITSFHTLTP